jgi:hypothetical protein
MKRKIYILAVGVLLIQFLINCSGKSGGIVGRKTSQNQMQQAEVEPGESFYQDIENNKKNERNQSDLMNKKIEYNDSLNQEFSKRENEKLINRLIEDNKVKNEKALNTENYKGLLNEITNLMSDKNNNQITLSSQTQALRNNCFAIKDFVSKEFKKNNFTDDQKRTIYKLIDDRIIYLEKRQMEIENEHL